MSRTIIVSNRLPVKLTETNGELGFSRSEGGLATGLGSIYKQGDNVWIGWPGTEISDPARQKEVADKLDELNLKPVFLTQEEISQYYEGFSNETLWPVFHYMTTYAKYQQSYWDYYVEVNLKFRNAILDIAQPGDTIWIHDYQLLLLPGMVRSELSDVSIGFFQHIPFPSYELFRLIPWRTEILEGMLGADLIGFHTFDDARHFVNTSRRLLPVVATSNVINHSNRATVVDSFPMGIDSEMYASKVREPGVQKFMKDLEESFKGVRLILTIDRLDYSKGIIQRLQAFDLLLQLFPEYIGTATLYMIVVPSRDTVQQYKELRDDIDKLVGNINSRYRTMNWQPVNYFYRSLPLDELSALYAKADICLVTPMRDGMNLVCKEYVASRIEDDGVLILSEMAGASKELVEAVIVNPNNIGAIMDAINEALRMPLDEQQRRMRSLRQIVMKFNITFWVKMFMNRLAEVKQMQQSMYAKRIGHSIRHRIIDKYLQAQKRLIFLDYDGTLVGFKTNINQAAPDDELNRIIDDLTSDPHNQVVIVSGRDPKFLEKWFGRFRLEMISEHGAYVKRYNSEWVSLPGLNSAWKKDIQPVLESFTDRTPGSFVEEKDFSLVWHYRRVEESLAELRTAELMNTLRYMAQDMALQVLPGNKVIEVKNIEINKGKAALSLLNEADYDFVVAIGDDYTDEDIFKSLPESAFTIKVGTHVSAALYYTGDYMEVRSLLKDLISSTRKIETTAP
jgi:trehalose 6-phosphate synthase/phosphatase